MKFHLTVSENGSDRVFVDKDFDCLFGVVSVGGNHFISLYQGACTNGTKICALKALGDLLIEICKDMIDDDPIAKSIIDALFDPAFDGFITKQVVRSFSERESCE